MAVVIGAPSLGWPCYPARRCLGATIWKLCVSAQARMRAFAPSWPSGRCDPVGPSDPASDDKAVADAVRRGPDDLEFGDLFGHMLHSKSKGAGLSTRPLCC